MSLAKSVGTYFIPHHAVQKVEDENIELRVVFDASARPSHVPQRSSIYRLKALAGYN